MSRSFQFSLRALLATMLAVGCFVGGICYVRREPPQIGETAQAVRERWGPPQFDSRDDSLGDSDGDYQLGYTDGFGTRHHLHVKDGRTVEIEYSSR
jgi:hypothetical protein